MFVKTNILDIKSFKLLSCITDHYPLILTCNVEKPQSTNKHYYHYIDYKKMHDVFKQIHDWDFIYSQQNPDTAIEILINEIKRIIQLSTTRKKAHKKHIPRSKWIPPGIIKSCLEKEKMYKMWRQDSGNMTLKKTYQSYAKVLEKIILKAKHN